MFNSYYIDRRSAVYNNGMSDSDKKEITDSIKQVAGSVNDLKKSVDADRYTYKIGNVEVSTKELTWEIILNAFGLEDKFKYREHYPEEYAWWKFKTIAKFLNGQWKLSRNDFGYGLRRGRTGCLVTNNLTLSDAVRNIAFKDRESAEKAIKLMNKDIDNLHVEYDEFSMLQNDDMSYDLPW